jgi:glycosyltransferase involved in cell wall biosynthesis
MAPSGLLPENADIAVLIPCFNEELTIAKVVRDFKQYLPNSIIYVFDNNSTDKSAAFARNAGGMVIKEKRQGKGFVVAAMLEKIQADYYVMVDGDDTYPADCVLDLLDPLFSEEADMVVGHRLNHYSASSFRKFHLSGNRLVCWLINRIFSSHLTDPMSGYRAFTREVADNLPIVASGFDVETEMTLQLLYRHFVVKEIPIVYTARPQGSESKLRTFTDGFRILFKILTLFKAYKPLTFFGSLAILSALLGFLTGVSSLVGFTETGTISNLPLAILAVSFIILSTNLASIGLIVNTLNFRILELTNILMKQDRRKRGSSGHSK